MKLEGELWISVAPSQANGINNSNEGREKSDVHVPTDTEEDHGTAGNGEHRSANIMQKNNGFILHVLGLMGIIGIVILSSIIYLKARND